MRPTYCEDVLMAYLADIRDEIPADWFETHVADVDALVPPQVLEQLRQAAQHLAEAREGVRQAERMLLMRPRTA